MFKSDQRLSLTRDNKVVPSDHKDAHRLLVRKGGKLTDKRAKDLGLVEGVRVEDFTETKTITLGGSASREMEKSEEQEKPQDSKDAPKPPQVPESGGSQNTGQKSQVADPLPATSTEVPAGFPSKDILAKSGIDSLEKLRILNREQLTSVDQIGSARADEIMAALAKLEPVKTENKSEIKTEDKTEEK